MIDLTKIDRSWTLFLDRDGVINHEKYKDYIHTWDEFQFYEGAKEAIALFTKKFKHIIVITNQRGIGKGITRMEDVKLIHKNMSAEIGKAGGRIDAVYFCPDLDEASPDRKPNTGMGLKAVQDFPDIDLSKTIMVGNTISDMQFGRNAGIYTVFAATTNPDVPFPHPDIDLRFDSLADFAKSCQPVGKTL